jgi:hypothetical protein
MDALHHVTVSAPALAASAGPFAVRAKETGQGLFATRALGAGTRLFSEEDWTDEAERKRFSRLSPKQLAELAPSVRALFLRFAHNAAAEEIRGTFHPEAVQHPVNFINHSCDPNAGYDGADHIVALVRIAAGEEILMDYGTYSFSFDHEFACRCGALRCRGKVTRNDWPQLVRAGLRLPTFMRREASRALWG